MIMKAATIFNNGKIRISLFDGIPLVEIYHDGELNLEDALWANHVILHELDVPTNQPVTAIINLVGSYSLSVEASVKMEELMKDAFCVAYITHSISHENLVQFARDMYLLGKRVESFHSIKDAHAWIKMNLNSVSV